MRRVSLLLVVFLTTAALALTLSPDDRDKGVKYLEQTRDGVVAATKGLSEAQLNFKPAPDKWSIAQVLEHIALAEDGFYQNVTENVMKAPAGPSDRDVAKIDSAVVTMVPDRSHKVQAPPQLVPTGRWTAAEALDHFLKTRAKTLELLESKPDLRAHVVDSPFGQKLDGYEWLLFAGGHSERHTKQIEEVKADPNFPKS